jgi:hypothetical protein
MKPLISAAQRPRKLLSSRRLKFEPLEGRHLLATLFRINAGGPELAGSPVWQADTAAAPSPYSNASAGNTGVSSTTATIDMTHASLPTGTPMALFQTERFDKSGAPNMLWDFPVTPGEYEVRLYFAETWSGAFANGVRVFDVQIEGATVLDNYDVFADVGANKGVMKSFVVTSDANLDVDFLRVLQNPAIKGIEILTAGQASPLNASASALNFGSVAIGQTATQQLTLTNGGASGAASITIDPAAASIAPAGSPFGFSFAQSTPITLAPGQSTVVTVNYSPTSGSSHSASLVINHSGSNSPLSIGLSGTVATQSSSATYRINAGGAGVSGTPPWAPDTAANPSTYSNIDEGGNSAVRTTTATIDMTHASVPAGTPMSIFQSERFDKAGAPNLLWDFPVTPGKYEVRLYFAETYSGAFATGVRVFDVQIEGATLLDNYDIFADVGALKGVVKSFVVTADSNLDIDFLRVAQNPTIMGIEILPVDQTIPISFSKSILGGTTGLDRPTSLQFGPDGRLYVAQQNGLIRAYTVQRTAANDYDVIGVENITLVQQIPNHNDDGTPNSSVTTRLVTGILVTGTATNPVLYVNSSDPRIGGGSSGTDLNLDTNSSTISRLTKGSSSWTKVDLVRGLPRSEENHHANGMQLDAATNTLYVAMGGNTNMGATSNNFSYLPEYALSAAILSIDLNAIGNTTYNLPTLDDETRATQNDANDPFGGNDGRNQAKIVPGGPVQVFAPGFRNPYDLLIHSSGRMYTVDNGPNAGWGDVPINEGPQGTATNGVNEPGVTHPDGLHFITGPGYYGGHPNPTRANTNNKFNTSNPQSPVPVANPIEGDYRIPGVEDGALVVYPESTNGIAEYTTSHFNGAMKGDLIIASFDNTIKRVKLSADGTQVVSSTNLFTSVGFRPLDVTAPPSGPFAGSIWVCDVAQGTITVFEPNDSVGGDPDDLDGDGYSNDDEIANGTDPNNPGDVPPDYDADFTSNLTDPDDDNDSFPDTSDKFAVDAANGTTTPIGTFYGWENEGENLGGILGMGFTGLMTNGTSNYESLFDPTKVTAGGAAGVFTIDSAMPGTAKGTANSQKQAFQFGVNVGSATTPFVARTSILGPFNGFTPQAGQEMGFYIGTGDQDNFIQLVLSGDNGGSIKLGKEVNGSFTAVASQNLSMSGVGFVELRLTIDPASDTLQASYSVSGGAFVNLGGAVVVPATWIASVMAVGLISTDPTGSGAMPVTWDFLGVEAAAPTSGDGAAKIEVYSEGSIDNSSTAKVDSFRLHNTSTNGRQISSIAIDLSTTFMPDMVYDPNGTGGDTVGIAFTPNSGGAATGQSTHQYSAARDGGFDKLEVFFTNFDPGETFTYRLDIDPTSIKGSAAPGPGGSAHVSGLEISGATVTVNFVGGGSLTGQLFALPEDASFYKVHSEVVLNATATPAAPALSLVGVGTAPAIVTSASQTIRVTGAAGSKVRMLQTEVALHLDGVPNGGYDLDPYEANKVVFVRDDVATIGSTGFVDIPVTLRDSRIEGGINYFAAVVETPDGKTSNLSNVIKVALNDLPPGSVGAESTVSVIGETTGPIGDYDDNGQVDGADFLLWQRTLGAAANPGTGADGSGNAVVDGEDLGVWQDNFGASNSGQEAFTFSSTSAIEYDLSSQWEQSLSSDGEDDSTLTERPVDLAFEQAWRLPGDASAPLVDDGADEEFNLLGEDSLGSDSEEDEVDAALGLDLAFASLD